MFQLTVITPVYNSKEYLTQSLHSILNQTYTDFELILIDDGSTDGSSALCDIIASQDKRIKAIHQENHGQAFARNRALDMAQGDYIAFVDSDDYIHQRMFEWMLQAIVQSEADIVVCAHTRGTATDYVWKDCKPLFQVFDSRDFLRKTVVNREGKHWLLWDKIYKRSCFDGVRLPEGRIYEDNATVYKILYKANQVVVTDSVLYYYFTNENSTVNQSFQIKHLDWLLVVEEMISFFAEHQETEMLTWANNCYLTSLADSHRKARENCLDAVTQKQLYNKLYHQYLIEKKKYPINIHTYPMVMEELFPKKAKLLWMKDGIKTKLKRK